MMMHIAVTSIVLLSFGLCCPFEAVAQSRSGPPEHWQPVDRSMTDLLLEGYRPVSVIAPNPQRRIYFLNSGSFLAKCTEEATPTQLPPPTRLQRSAQQPAPNPLPAAQPATTQIPPLAQGVLASDPGSFMPEVQSTFACSRLSK
jgi:hypothetical protein